jgi:hypothetical protein
MFRAQVPTVSPSGKLAVVHKYRDAYEAMYAKLLQPMETEVWCNPWHGAFPVCEVGILVTIIPFRRLLKPT